MVRQALFYWMSHNICDDIPPQVISSRQTDCGIWKILLILLSCYVAFFMLTGSVAPAIGQIVKTERFGNVSVFYDRDPMTDEIHVYVSVEDGGRGLGFLCSQGRVHALLDLGLYTHDSFYLFRYRIGELPVTEYKLAERIRGTSAKIHYSTAQKLISELCNMHQRQNDSQNELFVILELMDRDSNRKRHIKLNFYGIHEAITRLECVAFERD